MRRFTASAQPRVALFGAGVVDGQKNLGYLVAERLIEAGVGVRCLQRHSSVALAWVWDEAAALAPRHRGFPLAPKSILATPPTLLTSLRRARAPPLP